MVIFDEFIEGDEFTESDWSEENKAPMFNIYILDIYSKTELTDDNNTFMGMLKLKYLKHGA